MPDLNATRQQETLPTLLLVMGPGTSGDSGTIGGTTIGGTVLVIDIVYQANRARRWFLWVITGADHQGDGSGDGSRYKQ
jgi:hypothetical protein